MVEHLIQGDVRDFGIVAAINVVCIIIFFGIFQLLRFIRYRRLKNKTLQKDNDKFENKWILKFRNLSYRAYKSNFMIFLEFLNLFMSLGFMGIYIANTVGSRRSKISVYRFVPDIIMAIYFLFIWFFKLFSSPKRFSFIFSPYTMIDLITISPVFISWVLNRYAVLGFFRALRIWIFLHFMSKLYSRLPSLNKNSRLVKFAQFIDIKIFLIWSQFVYMIINLLFSYAGLLVLFEKNGDPWLNYETRVTQDFNFFEYVYLGIVTASTVGFGDLAPKTALGRLTDMIFILTSIVVIPLRTNHLFELLKALPKTYGNKITPLDSRKTILVTGSINAVSLQTVLDSLFFENVQTSTNPPKITILNPFPLTPEISEVLSYPTFAPHTYFQTGSPMSRKTLVDLQVEKYKYVLILSDKNATNKEEEDSKNILKYLSIKNYCINVTIYIEILTDNMKKTLLNLPNRYVTNDNVVCVEEIRSLFFAQNCIYPGLSTLVTNMIRAKEQAILSRKSRWEYEYTRGVIFNIYFQPFAKHWSQTKMNFRQLVLSFYKWKPNILILGLMRKNNGNYQIHLSPFDFHIEKGDIAIMLTDELNESLKISRDPAELFASEPNIPKNFFEDGRFPLSKDKYLSERYLKEAKVLKAKYIETQKLKSKLKKKLKKLNSGEDHHSEMENSEEEKHRVKKAKEKKHKKKKFIVKQKEEEDGLENEIVYGANSSLRNIFLGSAAFYDYATVVKEEEVQKRKGLPNWDNFNGWPYTITSKKQATALLTDHIIVCGRLNKIFWFIAALRLNYLTNTNWYKKILILDPQYLSKTNNSDHDFHVEKRMKKLSKFPDIYYYSGSGLNRDDLRAVNIGKASKVVIFSSATQQSESQSNFIDSEAMYVSLNVEKEITDYYKKEVKNALVMELLDDGNMLFVDIATHLKYIKENIKENKEKVDGLTTPFFASGKVFSGAMFEMLLSQACFIPQIIPLVKIFASSNESFHPQKNHLALIPVFCENYHDEKGETKDLLFYDFRNSTFEDVVSQSVEKKILPFALFRKPSKEFDIDQAVHDYVVCMPENTTLIRDTDQIYAFVGKEVLFKLSMASKLKTSNENHPTKTVTFKDLNESSENFPDIPIHHIDDNTTIESDSEDVPFSASFKNLTNPSGGFQFYDEKSNYDKKKKK